MPTRLKVDFEFYKGILFIRLKGVLTEYSLSNNIIDKIINYMGFKYIVFNIDNIYQIDSYGINYLINHNLSLKNKEGKVFICQKNNLFLTKFISKVQTITKEREVFNNI